MKQLLNLPLAVLAVFLALPVFPARSADVPPLAPQTNDEGAVVVKVTPRDLGANASVWQFDISFNTHSVNLEGNPAEFTEMLDTDGHVYKPIGWLGDRPGGHHRSGTLQLPAPDKPVSAIELRIHGVGGIPARVFRWKLS